MRYKNVVEIYTARHVNNGKILRANYSSNGAQVFKVTSEVVPTNSKVIDTNKVRRWNLEQGLSIFNGGVINTIKNHRHLILTFCSSHVSSNFLHTFVFAITTISIIFSD